MALVSPHGYARGLVRDDMRIARQSFANLRSGLAGSTPRGQADLGAFLPDVLDQNLVSSCVMNAVPVAAVSTLAAGGVVLGFTPSVHAGYGLARGLDRAHTYPKDTAQQLVANHPLQDTGTQLYVGAQVLSDWGVMAMGPLVTVARYTRNSDCSPANCNVEPNLHEIQQSSTAIIVGAFEFTSAGATLANDIKLALDHGFMVAIGGFVDSSLDSYGPNSAPLGRQNTSDQYGGGHATLIYGYIDTPTGTIWLCRNSWGTQWGRAGNFQATDEFVLSMWEFLCMAVSLKRT